MSSAENGNYKETDGYIHKDTVEVSETHNDERRLGEFNIHLTCRQNRGKRRVTSLWKQMAEKGLKGIVTSKHFLEQQKKS